MNATFDVDMCPLVTPDRGPDREATQRVQPSDPLVLPMHRRMIAQYGTSDQGARELRLFYNDKEISFDKPEFFAFGEALTRHARFVAGSALEWAPDLGWGQVQAVLQQLLDAGVLVPGADEPVSQGPPAGERPSPLPPAPCASPRRWADCAAVTHELTGRPLAPGWLELIVPIFRVAHIAVDRDGRQVGEANVFPPALRLQAPTDWRTCTLPGNRYRSERPMNVTAMRTMRAHWAPMMAALLVIRAGFLKRYPGTDRAWTVGSAERLSVAVLAVPTYALMRPNDPVGHAELHPALSSLFRVMDGVRMTLHQMMFVPVGEAARTPSHPVGVDDILDYAERNFSFHSEHGVCAGPRAMVREMLVVMLEGCSDHASAPLDPAVQAALDDLEPAMDYGLLALRAHAALFSLWPAMGRAYEALERIVDAALGGTSGVAAVAAVKARLQAHRETLVRASYLGLEVWRQGREVAYDDMFRECGRGVIPAIETPPLGQITAPRWSAADWATAAKLEAILCRRLALVGQGVALAKSLSLAILDFLLRQRAIMGAAADAQAEVNRAMQRQAPDNVLDARDVGIHNQLQGAGPDRLPYLVDELAALFGLHIHLDADRLAVRELEAAR